MDQLLAISPIDGRYFRYTSILKDYFSEYALFKYRLSIEIKYLVNLIKILNPRDVTIICIIPKIEEILTNFSPKECMEIKIIEKKINHDVKAVEYYIKNKLLEKELNDIIPLIHFGLTSQDINNTATPISIKDFIQKPYSELLKTIIKDLNIKSELWKNVVIITRTHGQPATPSTFGKEMKVFSYRIEKQYGILKNIKYWGKFGGASGNLNAHMLAYPDIDWIKFSENFLQTLGLNRNKYTTQIDNYENLSNIFDSLKRINTILIDMCRDIWLYISMEYLILKSNKDEIGSSTMPHKINPINFENAEGNLMFANSILEFLSRKLPISRLQRDLTDSTILRNLGTVFGHILISFNNILSGLSKVDINRIKIEEDICKHRVVISEGIQTILRKHNYSDAYEKMKDFTRKNKKFTKTDLNEFIHNLKCPTEIENELLEISVYNYIGYSNILNL